MDVILKEDIEKLGKAGSVVKVTPGFARNYLFPKKLAVVSTQENKKIFETEKRKKQQGVEKQKQEALELSNKLSSFSCTIAAKAGLDDKLYGSVTSEDIAQSLKAAGMDIDKRKITISEPIKALGVYNIDISLYPEITSKIKVWVVKE